MRYRVVCLKLFNVKIYRMKYFRHEIFAIYGICSHAMYMFEHDLINKLAKKLVGLLTISPTAWKL